MAVRAQYGGSNEVGVFAKLTNAYCLVGYGGAENFYRCALSLSLSRFLSCADLYPSVAVCLYEQECGLAR